MACPITYGGHKEEEEEERNHRTKI